jgi:hypothetical protein
MFTLKLKFISLIILLITVYPQNVNNKGLINNNEHDIIFLSQTRQLHELEESRPTLDCNRDSDCLNGTCVNSVCVCTHGYTTYPPDSNPQCNYELKRQKTAFFYELFLSFGAGHFYCERNLMAAMKLVCFILGILIICLIPITTKYLSERINSDVLVITVSCVYYIYALGLAYWFIYDLVMFGLNRYKDGNGLDLVPWE